MKLLFDQNLSYRLPAKLSDLFPKSSHVRPLGSDRASDSVIFDYAKKSGFVIVAHDSDFVEEIKLVGWPPKVVWLRCVNSTPVQIESLLRAHQMGILDLAKDHSDSYLEIF